MIFLKKFGRIGNYSDVYKETATWYSRPLISGNKEADQARKYQYFDSVDAIDNIKPQYVISCGLAFGAALVLAPIYIAEISSAENRGKLVSLQQLNIVFGFFLYTKLNKHIKNAVMQTHDEPMAS